VAEKVHKKSIFKGSRIRDYKDRSLGMESTRAKAEIIAFVVRRTPVFVAAI
jgi:hypothetical protein